jgi:hypothetical protein
MEFKLVMAAMKGGSNGRVNAMGIMASSGRVQSSEEEDKRA